MPTRYGAPTIQGDDALQTYALQRALLRQRQPNDRVQWAKALMQTGASTAPVRSPAEGLARMLQAGLGGYFAGQAERDGEASEQEMLARLIGEREQRKADEAGQLARAGVPGFPMPMPLPTPGQPRAVPTAPAGGGPEVVPPGMPEAPPAPPTRPVDADLIAALAQMAAGGNRTAQAAMPGFQFQYQDRQAQEREARAEARADAREARMLAAQNRPPAPPAPTEMERMLVAAGFQPGAPEYQEMMRKAAERKIAPASPAASVTVAPNPPADHRAVYDDTGRLSHYEVIPGSPTAKKMQKEQFSDDDAVVTAEQTTGLIDSLLQHPGLRQGTGGTGVLLNRIPGTQTYDFAQRVEQLQGRAFLQAFESLKGGGQITETEGRKATQAIARLSTAQTEAAFREALQELRDITDAARGRIVARRQQLNGGQGGVAIPGSGGLTASPPPPPPPGFRVFQ